MNINKFIINPLLFIIVAALSFFSFVGCQNDSDISGGSLGSDSTLESSGSEMSSEVSSESSETDTAAPIITGNDAEIYIGEEIDYKTLVSVIDELDSDPQITVDDSKVDIDTAGVYPVIFTAKDSSGNIAELTINLTVKVNDTTPPVVTGQNFEVALGDSVSYKKQITVTDDYDNAPVISVDNSKVDLETLGTYPVKYTVTDASGNSTVLELTVTVKERTADPEITEEYVLSEANVLLEKIIKEEDSDLQKIYSIYRWCKTNIGYLGKADKTSWVIAAHDGFVKRSGDCYTYFAVSKALLTAAGFETFDVAKIPTRNNHYWLLVNLNGEYYHFDTTRFIYENSNFCMLTDEEIWKWDNTYYKGEHSYDNTGLPAVSTNSVQHRINYASDRVSD